MLKYTILYKNGKTWNGRVSHVNDIDVLSDKDIIHATVISGDNVRLIYPSRNYGCVVTANLYLNDHNHRANKVKKRTPNPNSKTKKQKAFDQAYADWLKTSSNSSCADGSIKAYKKWLWEQKNEKTVKVDKDGFIPWNGGEMPVPGNVVVDLKFRGGGVTREPAGASHYYWKHDGDGSDIVAYKVIEENTSSEGKIKFPSGATISFSTDGGIMEGVYSAWTTVNLSCSPKPPIKTTYTFWLGANGEIVDDK